MELQQPLTKENFWNEMTEKYPNAMKAFGKWIDEYKEAVGWNKLFKANENTMQLHSSTYKFHDLPYAMQLGIWLEYVCQRGGCQFEIEDFFQYDLRKDIEGFFKNILEHEAKQEFEDEE